MWRLEDEKSVVLMDGDGFRFGSSVFSQFLERALIMSNLDPKVAIVGLSLEELCSDSGQVFLNNSF